MATTNLTTVRTDTDHLDTRGVLLLCAYGGVIVTTVAAATGVALALSGFTTGLGEFVLLAGGWLAVVSASPALARRSTVWLAELELGQRAPRSTHAVDAVVTYILAR